MGANWQELLLARIRAHRYGSIVVIHNDLEKIFTGCTQVERFLSAGWHSATSWNMNEVYGLLPRSEVDMIVPQLRIITAARWHGLRPSKD